MIYWILGILTIIALGYMFKKHLKKIGLAIALFVGGWIGLQNTDVDLPQPTDPVIEIPVDTADASDTLVIPEKPIDTIPTKPKDTIGKVYKIKLSEVGDQTVSLQQQIDKIPSGTTDAWNVIQLPSGRFWTEGDLENNPRGNKGIIRIENKHYIIIRGPSGDDKTTLYTKAPAVPFESKIDRNEQSNRRHIWIIGCSDFVVKDIRIEGSDTIEGTLIGTTPEFTPDFWKGGKDKGSINGANAYHAPWEAEHAIDVRASKNGIIENIEVSGVWGDGIYIGNSALDPSENIIVRNNYIEYVGRQGIGAAQARNLKIYGNVIHKGRRASIDLEPFNNGFVDNVEIYDNKLHAVQVPLAMGGKGNVSNISFHHNEYSGGALIAYDSNKVNPSNRKNYYIGYNKRTDWFGSPQAAIKFIGIENITIEHNEDNVSSKQSLRSVHLEDCTGEIIVRNNNFSGGQYILKLGNTTEIINEGNTPEQIIKEY
ncbi:Right handed beta helix region [Salinimicrobium sediminis]|uniref:Right handed beta helix region n=1 Tax=Salinimicrobium sediminis TaxID=1343891 RepID=A0A285X485_9FLAO|nr:right-handed parallel beta-helix repeat-containing protein [Salinimicrobium sediminis]SOC79816.1 Right handed beta helix region [Salinimicrobium sediminis]